MRSKDWKETDYSQRKTDWLIHDLIVEKLATFEGYRKASEEQDFDGIDYWKGEIPFDLKVTNQLPVSYKGDPDNKYTLFQWYLCHQDLERFKPTNRVIVITEKDKNECSQKDADIIAFYIRDASYFDYLYNVPYVLWGNKQHFHFRYGECHTMEVGLLIHYK